MAVLRVRNQFMARAAALAAMLVVAGCNVIIPDPPDVYVDGKLQIDYWVMWTGIYGDAIQSVVNDFNASQDRVFVKLLIVSEVQQKALLAIAAGTPPDLIDLINEDLPKFACQNALTPLDTLMAEYGVKREDFLETFIDLTTIDGKTVALPVTPATHALYWNKDLFEQAGLDPERPPCTLEELDEFALKLTRYDDQNNLVQLGFTPYEPHWWTWAWFFWFGGRLWDGHNLTIDTPENLRALNWLRSYSERYGQNQLQSFESGFGSMTSAQDAFVSRRVAMVRQGVWMDALIDRYAPGLRWGAAPFPTPGGVTGNCTVAECNAICIPAGARHPREAFAFIKYLTSRGPSEKLNLLHGKFTPIKDVSPDFVDKHSHPYIRVFMDLARSPNTHDAPKMPVWYEFHDEINPVIDKVRLGGDPASLLADLQRRMDQKWARTLQRALRRDAAWEGGVS